MVELLFFLISLEIFFNECWEKKFFFVKWDNVDFYGFLFLKKDLEVVLKKEEILFIEDVFLMWYVEGKMELLNGVGRVNLKYVKVVGVVV